MTSESQRRLSTLREAVDEDSRPAEPTLEPGMERVDKFMVEDRLLTDVGGTIGASVLSTPGMVAMMERCAAVLVFERLDEGQATVGFEIHIKHVAAGGGGATCRVRATPRHGGGDRQLRFAGEG